MEFGERQRLYWHRSLPRRDPGNPAVEGFARPKVDLLRRWLPTDREHLILEVGAGNSYLTGSVRRRARRPVAGRRASADAPRPRMGGDP